MTFSRFGILGALATAAALIVAGCGGGGGGIGGTGSALGTMRLSLTDAPACGFDQVNVTIASISVNASETDDSSWIDIPLSTTRRINLLDYNNGAILTGLGAKELPAGNYTQMRLMLAENAGGPPYANSVKPTGGSEVALDTPSGQQTGIKVNVDMTVPAGQEADFVLDFDACKSVVRRGNSGRYNLKPVITVQQVLLTDAGLRVAGAVDAALVGSDAVVSLQSPDGTVVKATAPGTSGQFTLYPVPAGTYNLVVSAGGRVTTVLFGVPVVSGTPTAVSGTLVPPVSSTQRGASGTVTPDTATVHAIQTLANTQVIEAAYGAVQTNGSGTGSFAFVLPVEAPVTATWALGVVPTFSADAVAGGLYTIEAALAGVKKTAPADIRTAPATGIALAF